jgi:hypothetical protein
MKEYTEKEVRLIIEGAIAAEREACAKVAENGRFLHDDSPEAKFGKACAAAIRARGQPEPWVKTYSGGKPNYTQPKEKNNA